MGWLDSVEAFEDIIMHETKIAHNPFGITKAEGKL